MPSFKPFRSKDNRSSGSLGSPPGQGSPQPHDNSILSASLPQAGYRANSEHLPSAITRSPSQRNFPQPGPNRPPVDVAGAGYRSDQPPAEHRYSAYNPPTPSSVDSGILAPAQEPKKGFRDKFSLPRLGHSHRESVDQPGKVSQSSSSNSGLGRRVSTRRSEPPAHLQSYQGSTEEQYRQQWSSRSTSSQHLPPSHESEENLDPYLVTHQDSPAGAPNDNPPLNQTYQPYIQPGQQPPQQQQQPLPPPPQHQPQEHYPPPTLRRVDSDQSSPVPGSDSYSVSEQQNIIYQSPQYQIQIDPSQQQGHHQHYQPFQPSPISAGPPPGQSIGDHPGQHLQQLQQGPPQPHPDDLHFVHQGQGQPLQQGFAAGNVYLQPGRPQSQQQHYANPPELQQPQPIQGHLQAQPQSQPPQDLHLQPVRPSSQQGGPISPTAGPPQYQAYDLQAQTQQHQQQPGQQQSGPPPPSQQLGQQPGQQLGPQPTGQQLGGPQQSGLPSGPGPQQQQQQQQQNPPPVPIHQTLPQQQQPSNLMPLQKPPPENNRQSIHGPPPPQQQQQPNQQQPQQQGSNQGQGSSGINTFPANVVPPQSQGQPFKGTPQQHPSQDIQLGRNSPDPRSVNTDNMTEDELSQYNMLLKEHKELREKYNKVKKHYFDKEAHVKELQNTIASHRMSQSRTSLDDTEYEKRFDRLQGLIAQLAFVIRKEWKSIPDWLHRSVNKNAIETGKQEMTAVGRAFITKWLMEEVFNKYFHPDLEENLSKQLKQIQLNIRNFAPPFQSREDEEQLAAKTISWRLTTLEGLQDVLRSPQAAENREKLSLKLQESLVAAVQMHLQEPAPPDLEGGVHMIIELVVEKIAVHIPQESRDVVIEWYPPGYSVLSDCMKLETTCPALTQPIAGDPSTDTGDRASLKSTASDLAKDAGSTSSAEDALAKDHAGKSAFNRLMGSSKKPAPNQVIPPVQGKQGGGSQVSLTQKDDQPQRVRMAACLGVRIRGRPNMLYKAPVYAT